MRKDPHSIAFFITPPHLSIPLMSQVFYINSRFTFICRLYNIIILTEDIPPRIVRTLPSMGNNNNEIYVSPGEPLSLTCQVENLTATTQYFWNDTRVNIL